MMIGVAAFDLLRRAGSAGVSERMPFLLQLKRGSHAGAIINPNRE